MKIVKPGILSKEGIHRTCPQCQAEFIIENREDIKADMLRCFDPTESKMKSVKSYYYLCPCCNYEFYLGINPTDLPNLVNECIEFKREDWEERFG